MSKTIIITGAAGFIGSNFAHWLINNTEFTIIGIDNLSGGKEENLPDDTRFRFIKADINDDYMENVFGMYKPFVCYHFAAYASEGRSNHIRKFIHQNNTVGAANIINCCVNHNCKLVFTSSVAVYSGTPPYNEDTPPTPIDEYGLSKFMTEQSIRIAGQVNDLDWVIVRPRNVYGERQSLTDPSRNLFGIFCYNALKELPLQIFGSGSNIRNFTYIQDLMLPLYKAIKYNKQVFNLGSGVSYTIKQAAEMFAEVSGYGNIIHTQERHEVKEAFCDINKSQQCLGYEDDTTLYAGLKKMWAWAKQQPLGQRETPPQLEITKNTHISLL